HFLRELTSGNLPEWEKRLETCVLKVTLTVGANLLEKKVAEGNGNYTLGDALLANSGHDSLIVGVRAGPGKRNRDERQASRTGLCFHQRAPRAVHGHAIKR